MTYFVFIERDSRSVPHMEPLIATGAEDAMEEARDLMGLYLNAVAAHVFENDTKIGTLTPKNSPDSTPSQSEAAQYP